jgi:D-glycero-D-manno-heptose 1,7-bisphosphate phosphatase
MGKHEVKNKIEKKKAVFLDRDGVILDLIYNTKTREYEPPHSPGDLFFCEDAFTALGLIQAEGFSLFLVSNQPDYAKGKTSMQNILAVHKKFDHMLTSRDIHFRDYYYCYHHPGGITPEYSFPCVCRKPEPFFLKKAEKDYGIDLGSSWMIGDRDSDIKCGQSAGTKTILIKQIRSKDHQNSSQPDFYAANLNEAVKIIINDQESDNF